MYTCTYRSYRIHVGSLHVHTSSSVVFVLHAMAKAVELWLGAALRAELRVPRHLKPFVGLASIAKS